MAQYRVTTYNKTPSHISLLLEKTYIQKFITIAYLRYCFEILYIDLYIFLALAI